MATNIKCGRCVGRGSVSTSHSMQLHQEVERLTALLAKIPAPLLAIIEGGGTVTGVDVVVNEERVVGDLHYTDPVLEPQGRTGASEGQPAAPASQKPPIPYDRF